MFASSVVASKLNYESVTEKVKSASTLGYLMIASTVLIIAIVFTSNYNWRNLYALAVACVSVLLCAILIFLESKGSEMVKKMKLPILSFFAFIWAFVVIFCKYRLFPPSNNGKIDRMEDPVSHNPSRFPCIPSYSDICTRGIQRDLEWILRRLGWVHHQLLRRLHSRKRVDGSTSPVIYMSVHVVRNYILSAIYISVYFSWHVL